MHLTWKIPNSLDLISLLCDLNVQYYDFNKQLHISIYLFTTYVFNNLNNGN